MKDSNPHGLRIYVASSWRNARQPEVVAALREDGHTVYDFRNPKPGDDGFRWSQIGLENGPQQDVARFGKALHHQRAVEGFRQDMTGLRSADVTVLLLPSGRAAHLEAGFAAGQGQKLAVLVGDYPFEPELMYRMAHILTDDLHLLRAWLRLLATQPAGLADGGIVTPPAGPLPMVGESLG